MTDGQSIVFFESSRAANRLTVVFLENGCESETISDAGVDVAILDLDVLENGECPYCQGEIDPNADFCLECGIDWANNANSEIFDKIKFDLENNK